MGTLKLSGVLSRPVSGEVVANARISFDAVATGTVVLKGVSSVCKSAADGTYSVDLQYGDYSVQVSWSGQTQQYGVIHIDSTTPIGDLNTLLLQNIMEQQVTPEIVLEFRQLEQEMQEDLAQMEQLNAEATGAASAASLSEQNAATSEIHAAASESAAAGSATAAEQSASASASSASEADTSQKKASTSEVNAATSEDNAAISARNASISEGNAAISAGEAATSQTAASVSEVNSAANAGAAGTSATSANKSASAAAASEINSKTSETNAANSSKAAGEYAQEAKDASSKVTAPLTDQGTWAIQSGYPATPSVASVWQVVDGGLDPSNPEIIWNAGDLLIYLASTGAWCRMLGQQTVSGDPVPLRFDSDIVLANAKLQFVTSSTTKVDAVGLDSENSLVLGDAAIPNICLLASAPTNMFVLVPDGNGGFTKSRIYTEAFPPPSIDTSHFVPDSRKVNGHALTSDVNIVPADIEGLGTAATHNEGDFFPFRGNIAAGVDLNTLTGSKYGYYYQSSNANATAALNYPVTQAGYLRVIQNGANGAEGCAQEYVPYGDNILYRRFFNASNSTWSSGWTSDYNSSHVPTMDKVGDGIYTHEMRQSGTPNGMRIAYQSYGAFWRNDGSSFYLMLTNKDDALGSYNSLRPFWVNLATGETTIGTSFNVTNSGGVKDNGVRVYSSKYTPPYPVTSVNKMTGAVNVDVGYTPSNPPPYPVTSLVPSTGGVGETSFVRVTTPVGGHGVSVSGSSLAFAAINNSGLITYQGTPSGTWRVTGQLSEWSNTQVQVSTCIRTS